MPIYTDTELKDILKPELLKLLKGKSRFHIRKLNSELENLYNSLCQIHKSDQ